MQMKKSKKSLQYWKNREHENIKKQIKSDKVIAKKIKVNQKRAMRDIQKEIDAFYGKYASKEGITMEDARKRIAKHDVKAFQSKAKKYVKTKDFSPRANEELRLYNVTMKTNRLEALKADINLELVGMANKEERIMLDSLHEHARQEYKRQSGILGETLNFNEKNISKIVNSSFNNATWSERLWTNQAALRSELDILLNKTVVQGRGPRELARELRQKFDSSIYNSERLMRTESARVQIQVQEDSYKRLEIEEYMVITEPDACDICIQHDGEVYPVKDMEIGFNSPVFHPNCKCATSGYIARD